MDPFQRCYLKSMKMTLFLHEEAKWSSIYRLLKDFDGCDKWFPEFCKTSRDPLLEIEESFTESQQDTGFVSYEDVLEGNLKRHMEQLRKNLSIEQDKNRIEWLFSNHL